MSEENQSHSIDEEQAAEETSEEATAVPLPQETESTQTSRPRQTTAPVSPPAPDPAFERRAVRRGCFSIVFGAALGAMVGAALTLALLSWLNNGTLTYNQASVQLRNQLDDEIATRQTFLEEQAVMMDDLLTRQAGAESTMAHAVDRVEAGMSTTEAEVAKLQVTAVYLETRIGQAGNAADTLDAFLLGLDALLSDVEAVPEPSATPTVTPTP